MSMAIFEPSKSNVEHRIVKDLDEVKKYVEALRTIGNSDKIVLTQGSFDIAHVGHFRYLEAARNHGSILVVGVDGDAKIRRKKGPKRPIVGETERAEIICHSRYGDLVVIKQDDWEKWALIKAVKPNVLIATEETYDEKQISRLKEMGCEVVVLPPQATTSTTARIRELLVEGIKGLADEIAASIPELVNQLADKALHGYDKPPKEGDSG